ncbi:hypothetical protein E7Z59_10090 [Robertkochia marina]|uniref:Beta-carotene 15,15'-monooxygenase n=1 Tax=Robertkochia marina TaxID=1227945 RepID=A0A4S3M1T9_9FLAO|nr:hypothetical protein [Robertkochia marina]THD67987.1 hypothetical protein E7Z59_10090 [Robertkochia marina]TRZ41517.1 hypothetical protein D3A96_13020 [Robertkochia marina]
MTKAISLFKEKRLLFLFIPLIILLSSWHLANNPEIISRPGLALGITIDLVVLLPICWLLIIARTRIPNFSVLPVTIFSIVLSSFIIPESYQETLDLIRYYVLPLFELGLAGYVIYKTIKTISSIRKQTGEHRDAYEVIRNTCSGFTSSERFAAIFATELAMFWYALGNWKAGIVSNTRFSGYKESGIVSIMAGILLILIVETVWLHKFLLGIHTTLAWIVFGLSVYSGIQLFAHLKALRSRLHEFEQDALTLRYGIFSEVRIEYDKISRIEFTTGTPGDTSARKLALLGELEPHNIALHLKEPVTINRFYGLTSEASAIFFHCDEKARFKDLLLSKSPQILNV